jgi:TonB-linked SusC/RagA family outer membrane protein
MRKYLQFISKLLVLFLVVCCMQNEAFGQLAFQGNPGEENRAIHEKSLKSISVDFQDQKAISGQDIQENASIPLAMTITGKVTSQESGDPLPGVNIAIKGTATGTVSDVDGNYRIEAPDGDVTLVFSFIGFVTQEVPVQGRSVIDISLVTDVKSLQEVVVIGYGTQQETDLTGSVSQVKTEELEAVPVYNVEEALKGRASGVRVTSNSGAPGSRVEVRIRGGNSMIGSNAPLYVVDGFPVTGGISFLNPSDIASINILKDASATAIYGARGANGVVIITTKSGESEQKGRIGINSYYGVQHVAKRYEMLNAKQYATVANAWLIDGGEEPFFNIDEVQNPGTDWQDEIFRVAPVQNHTISFSGSSSGTNYSLSGNYYNQEGIIINSGTERGSFRLNLDHDINNWVNLAVNINLSRRERNTVPVDNGRRGNTMFSGALSAPPTLPVYDENGLPTRIEQIYSFGSIDMNNPMLWAKPYKDRDLANTILVNNALDFKITKNLSFKTRLGLEYENSSHEGYSPIIFENDRGRASAGHTYWNSFLNENILSYEKDFNDTHSLNIIAGYTYQSYNVRSTNVSVSGFSSNITENFNIGSAETVNPPSSGISEWKLASWLGRANYSIDGKYYITASIRADGSSRFGEDNKWGVFPSGALAWRMSEENFMKNISFINNLKLRASYGITGNTALSPYQSLDRMSSVRYIYAGSESIGYAPSGISNNQLKWETTNQFDIGFDLGIINNRLEFTFDYYNKHTYDLLASVPLPPSVGFSYILQNTGEIQNRGLEFGISADVLTKEFKWDVSAQLSTNKNKVLQLAGRSDIVSSGQLSGLPGYNIARVGEPLGAFYGLIEDGLDENGFIKYVDVNKDGAITPLDRVILGNPYPDLDFGFNSNFSYKGFDLNVFLQGVYGNEIFFATAFTNLNSFQRGQNQFADLFGNYWTESNPDPNAKYPKISRNTQMRPSDRFIEDGSFLRLKSLQLAYNIPVESLGTNWFSSARVYLKATNLFTLTNFPGLNPEINTAGNDSQSIGSRLKTGTGESGYPNARIFGAGIQLNF